MFLKRFFLLIAVCTLVACESPRGGYAPYGQNAKTVSVVSASRGTGEYISSNRSSYQSYVSALEEAKKEAVFGKQLKQDESPVDDYLANLSAEDFDPHKKEADIQIVPMKNAQALSSLWGKPVGSVVEGVTLLDDTLRTRFNDAVSTTPVSSQARWRYGDYSFIFMPNSDIYQPFYSGGNCRDGVFVNFQSGAEERLRGLFCQKGRGADWYLVR